jgi:hypothetical protein
MAHRGVVRRGTLQKTPGRDVQFQRVRPRLRHIGLLRCDLLEKGPGRPVVDSPGPMLLVLPVARDVGAARSITRT